MLDMAGLEVTDTGWLLDGGVFGRVIGDVLG